MRAVSATQTNGPNSKRVWVPLCHTRHRFGHERSNYVTTYALATSGVEAEVTDDNTMYEEEAEAAAGVLLGLLRDNQLRECSLRKPLKRGP